MSEEFFEEEYKKEMEFRKQDPFYIWLASVKVGDMVCDSFSKHCKVTSIENYNDKIIIHTKSGIPCYCGTCVGPIDHEHWYVYILRCSDKTLYTGITNNLERRVKQHNSGKASKYTRGRGPVKVVKVFHVDTKSAALKMEYKIKQMSKEDKLKYDGL